MKTLILMMAVVLVGCGTTSWVSNPSDPNNVKIEMAIRRVLEKPTGKLTKADLETVTELDLKFKQLTEVPKGLEKLTKLTELNLGNNQLTDVKGLKKLTQLTKLWLHNNRLTNVKGLENLIKLVRIDLRYNQLADVKGLGKLTQMEELHFHGNQLTDVKDLVKLTQLNVLEIRSNKLTNVKGLEKLTQLEELHLKDNPALTKAQIDELQKVLPKCKIIHNATK